MVTLSLCMIALNEEDWIQELLTQAKEFVDEIIVVDTGSVDRTKEIAKECNAKIIDFKWVDDFSMARNEGVKRSKSDWILCLDADERITKKGYKKIKELINSSDTDAFFLLQRNYTENQKLFGWQPNDKGSKEAKGKGYTDNPLIRLFRNKKGIVFSNPVHEVVDQSLKNIGATIQKTNIVIHHYGNLKKEKDIKGKMDKYLRISENQIKIDPANPRPFYEAGKVLKSMERFEEAKGYLEKAVALNPNYQLVLTNLADVYNKLGKEDLAVQTYLRAIKIKPKNENAYINLAILLYKKNELGKSLMLLDKAIGLNPKSAAAYHNLFLLLVKAKKYPQALTVLERAIEKTGLQRFKDVLSKFKPKVEEIILTKQTTLTKKLHKNNKDGENIEIATQLGHLFFVQKKFNEATKLFTKVLGWVSDDAISNEHLNPLIFNMYANLALAYSKINNDGEALNVLNKALSLNPQHKEFFEIRIKNLKN